MGAIKINGETSGSTTITAPATGSDESIELSTALAAKAEKTGSVLQVKQSVLSTKFTSSTKGSYVAITGLSVTITPSSATSKILVLAEVAWDTQNNFPVLLHLYRDGGQITPNGQSTGFTPSSSYTAIQQPADQRAWFDQQTLIFLDSPAATSELTYQVYVAKPSVAASNIIINPFGSSNITVMEIGA